MDDPVEAGRTAFAVGAWDDAYRHLRDAGSTSLAAGDLHRLGMAAYLTGRDGTATEVLALCQAAWQETGDERRSARAAFWVGLLHVDRGELAQANGWFARGERLVAELDECAEGGLLLIPGALQAMGSGDPAAAMEQFRRAGAIGQRVDDRDLCALARLGEGQSLVLLGRAETGMRLLDEVMIGVIANESSPLVTGLLYCAVIETCEQIMDVRRADEWTTALGHWCAQQPDLVPYRGRCLVHRAEVLRHRGAWDEARAELQRARDILGGLIERPALGGAHYQLGELHRLRGDLAAAEEAYGEASRRGHDPRPGLARLRLLQGRAEEARSSLLGLADETNGARMADLLATTVEVALVSARLDEARTAADRLQQLVRPIGTGHLLALANYCDGRVRCAAGDPAGACGPLRRAVSTWQELRLPLETARARAALGVARRALGDHDTATLELDAARRVFRELGAKPDLDILDALDAPDVLVEPDLSGPAGSTALAMAVPSPRIGALPLTDRELEVLRHASHGSTNREIAQLLHLSEHTVRRHLQNIFAKLGVTSRAAATAHAYEHGLFG